MVLAGLGATATFQLHPYLDSKCLPVMGLEAKTSGQQNYFHLDFFAGAELNSASQVPTTLMLSEADVARMRRGREVDRLSDSLHRSLAAAFAPRIDTGLAVTGL